MKKSFKIEFYNNCIAFYINKNSLYFWKTTSESLSYSTPSRMERKRDMKRVQILKNKLALCT